jgi:hypothetical protein
MMFALSLQVLFQMLFPMEGQFNRALLGHFCQAPMMTACSLRTKSMPDWTISRGVGKIKERSVASAPRHTPKIAVAIKNNSPNRDFRIIPPYEAEFVLY